MGIALMKKIKGRVKIDFSPVMGIAPSAMRGEVLEAMIFPL